MGVRAGYAFQSFCSGEEPKGFPLLSLTQTSQLIRSLARISTIPMADTPTPAQNFRSSSACLMTAYFLADGFYHFELLHTGDNC